MCIVIVSKQLYLVVYKNMLILNVQTKVIKK